ncbi:hypothetical protein MTR67_018688 [Solanum verrucosum]|uniref:Uncharacterized protein n=1 Tax=Solanum verrucosum TaxID=315347 RepID=A0AAF0QLG1_SOLVR|nr:hypothetical protein MTR67_018688 [Solanum verrucosum]
MTNEEIRSAFLILARAMAAQATRDMGPRVNANEGFAYWNKGRSLSFQRIAKGGQFSEVSRIRRMTRRLALLLSHRRSVFFLQHLHHLDHWVV